ncbi:MAG: hypothetical protein EOL89_09345, partial [Actinobacteria bacterium]|nr:hypothetical protein [Actinomycetota bacterium]
MVLCGSGRHTGGKGGHGAIAPPPGPRAAPGATRPSGPGRADVRHLGDRTSAYVDGRLTGRRLARAEAHLRACPACARNVEAERALAERLRSLGPADAPADLE